MKLNAFKLILLLFCTAACEKNTKEDHISAQNNTDSISSGKTKEKIYKKNLSSVFNQDHLPLNNVLVNRNSILTPKEDFKTMYAKADSVKAEIWECGNPFEWLDKEWMAKTYGNYSTDKGTFGDFDGTVSSIYLGNSTYTTNEHVVLFDRTQMEGNEIFIKSHQILLTENTTIEEFQKLFPQIKKSETDVKNTFIFRIPLAKDNDDAFLFFFTNGKLNNVKLWWLLC